MGIKKRIYDLFGIPIIYKVDQRNKRNEEHKVLVGEYRGWKIYYYFAHYFEKTYPISHYCQPDIKMVGYGLFMVALGTHFGEESYWIQMTDSYDCCDCKVFSAKMVKTIDTVFAKLRKDIDHQIEFGMKLNELARCINGRPLF